MLFPCDGYAVLPKYMAFLALPVFVTLINIYGSHDHEADALVSEILLPFVRLDGR